MERREQVFIGVSFVALVALVLYDMRTKAMDAAAAASPIASNPMAAATAEGPSYLLYNQPWFFSPPVGNFMPQQTVGQAGQTAAFTPAPTSQATCAGCG